MGIYVGATEVAGLYVGATEISDAHVGSDEVLAETMTVTDATGALTVRATRRSRGANIDYSITDTDGIRSITSVVMVAGDDTRSDVTSQIARDDANTFSGTSARNNNKWRVASITITYVDATSGASHTLTERWSL